VKWSTYDGNMATLDYPAGGVIDEGENHRAREIHMVFKTSSDEVLSFSLIDYVPTSGIRDAGLFIKNEIHNSPQPDPIVVKQTSFDRFPAQEFTTYIPETTDNADSSGNRVFRESFMPVRKTVFVCANGDVCEVSYNLPQSDSEDYEPIFKKMTESIRLKGPELK